MSGGEIGGQTLTLDQLVGLNEELSALVRAGLPLEHGLIELGKGLRGKVGALSQRLGARISAGESLQRIVETDEGFPPLWRAVVMAGLRSGRLAAALESVTTTAQRMSENRRGVGVALVYPVLVILLAFAEFVAVTTYLAPRIATAYRDLVGEGQPLVDVLVQLGQTAKWWGPVVPIVFLVGLTMWWFRSGQTHQLSEPSHRGSRTSWMTRFLPIGYRRTKELGQLATFSEVLSLLVAHRVPLDEAIGLAADATGNNGLQSEARELSSSLRLGATSHEPFQQTSGHSAASDRAPNATPSVTSSAMPPILRWLISSRCSEDDLVRSLKRSAQRYREEADRQTTKTMVYLPIALTAFVGGIAVLLELIVVFGPIQRLLLHLAASS